MKKKLSYFLFLLLFFVGIGGDLYAQKGSWQDTGNVTSNWESGTGTQSDPYLIKTAQQLAYLAFQVNNHSNSERYRNTYFKIHDDVESIDLGAHYWVPIGAAELSSSSSGKSFQGWFNGNGKTIRNLFIQESEGTKSIGLFGYIEEAYIENLYLEGVDISGGASRVGGIAGVADNSAVSRCSVVGYISGTDFVGALVGRATATDFDECYSFVSAVYGLGYVGGLVGLLERGSVLSTCYSIGAIIGHERVGGLIGNMADSDGPKMTEASNSYSKTYVVGEKKTGDGAIGGLFVGGIAGRVDFGAKLFKCFAYNPAIKGYKEESVHRVAGYLTSGSLQDNYAWSGMLLSNNGEDPHNTVTDDPVEPQNTPNGKGLSDDDEWDGGNRWDYGDREVDDPYLQCQSAPVVRVSSSTQRIVVRHRPDFKDMKNVILLDQNFKELAVSSNGINGLIRSNGDPQNNTHLWTFTPVHNVLSSFDFEIGDVFYVVAHEKGKMPSYPVEIVISPFDEGNGSENSPFIIDSEGKLDSIRYYPDKYYRIVRDLDLSKYKRPWKPIETFTGNLDGNGHVIDSLLVLGAGNNQGLFEDLEGTVKNLGLENVYVTGTDFVGALAGISGGVIENVYTTGTIIATGNNVGGLLGKLNQKTSASVLSCYSSCLVKGDLFVGGLIGSVSSKVKRCYATGPVSGNNNVGGLLGELSSSDANVSYSYSTGLVSGKTATSTNIYGFTGRLSSPGNVSACCYYDGTTSGQPGRAGAENVISITKDAISLLFATENDYWHYETGYYPQLKIFVDGFKTTDRAINKNVQYSSALSVVPIKFLNEENANSVRTSFVPPLKYKVNGSDVGCDVRSWGGSAKCLVSNGKIISIMPDKLADTLVINIPTEDLGLYKKQRRMCFIPEDTKPVCKVTLKEGYRDSWSKKVVYELSTLNMTNVISGTVKYQNTISLKNASTWSGWRDVASENTFNNDTTICVQYRAVSGSGLEGDASDTYNVNIDKTRPAIAAITTNGTKENPAQKQATFTVKFKDPRVSNAVEPSGIDKLEWEIPDIEPARKGSITDFNQLVPDAGGYLTESFDLPQLVGQYSVLITITDKAGNVINSDDAGYSLKVYVEDDDVDSDEYILDNVTVDGNDAKVDDTDPLVWRYSEFCVEGETAEVILTPAAVFGYTEPIKFTVTGLEYKTDNKIEKTIVSKDGKVSQTFTIYICREVPVAFFRSLFVNEPVKLSPQIMDYSVAAVDYNVSKVLIEYELEPGESCVFSDTPLSTTYSGFHNLNEPGMKTKFTFPITSADGSKTKIYTVTVPRKTKDTVTPPDDIDHGDSLEEDPESDHTNPSVDDDGNIVYDLVSKCDVDEHYLKVTPKPDGTVTFKNGDGPAETRDNNTYKFEIANRYKITAVVTLSNNDTRTYIFNVVKKFHESVFYNRWASNDVITINNNSNNNGGYSFTDYSWFLNGNPSTETRSYMEVSKGDVVEAVLSGEYNSTSTGVVTISEVPTCPCLLGTSTLKSILAYPSLLKSGEKVTISTENISDEDLRESSVNIVGSLGNTVDKVSLTGSKTEVAMPKAPGIYLLKVSTKSVSKEFKIILK